MIWKDWQIRVALGYAALALILLGMAMANWIPNIVVTIIGLVTGCVALGIWLGDRSAQSRAFKHRDDG